VYVLRLSRGCQPCKEISNHGILIFWSKLQRYWPTRELPVSSQQEVEPGSKLLQPVRPAPLAEHHLQVLEESSTRTFPKVIPHNIESSTIDSSDSQDTSRLRTVSTTLCARPDLAVVCQILVLVRDSLACNASTSQTSTPIPASSLMGRQCLFILSILSS
jgi:hypothetical protein